jgi:exodeoxyribonuclease V gamma subunit
MIAGKSADELLNYALATAQLPAGGIGEGYRNRIYSAAEQITDAVTAHGEAVSLEADITVKGLRIKGRIDGVTADGLVYAKHGILKPKDLLKTWIRRLVLHRADNQSAAVMVDIKGEKTALPEVFNHEALETLVELFLKGLKSPLCFNVDAGYKALDSAYKKQYPSVESPDSLKLGHEFMLCFGRDGYGENLALNGALIFGALEKAHADK